MLLITEENESRVAQLEDKLLYFYENTTDYSAFHNISKHPALWEEVLTALRESNAKRPLRVLEIGAGRSGFGSYLKQKDPHLRAGVHLCLQDVTSQNETHLRAEADEVHIGSIHALKGTYDVIFHGYVLEHIGRPRAFLEQAFALLEPGGSHFILCPRYDWGFYLPPALDHQTLGHKIKIAFRLLMCRSSFQLIEDPAALHLPFMRDRDAVHLVTKRGIIKMFGQRATIRSFHLQAGGLKDFILKKFLTLRLELKKPVLSKG